MANFKLVGVSSSTSVWLRVGVRLEIDVELIILKRQVRRCASLLSLRDPQLSPKGSYAIKLCLLCQPSCLMFSISYFIRHYILLKCVQFATFCLLYICKNAKEKENQTEINTSNQIKSNQSARYAHYNFCKKSRARDNYAL